MTRNIISLLFFSAFLQPASAQLQDKNLGIIPAPASVRLTEGTFIIRSKSNISIAFENQQDKKTAMLFRDFMKRRYDLDIPVKNKSEVSGRNMILFSSAHFNTPNKEAYQLTITLSRITVSGKDAGLFYGLQTLMQLFPPKAGVEISTPCAVITDTPRYKYRGLMLGVGYHIFPVKFIKELIDLMAAYKLNTLHWHLTEDNGWRIEIKKYPLLTKIGAWRKESQVGGFEHHPVIYDGTPYGGYYTQDQIREIVAYAAKRYITIIPEIEMPGHCLAALAAYSWLGCGGGPYQVGTAWDIYKEIYCPKDSTFHFLENVLTEVLSLFPSHLIHIGGDEVPKDSWKSSAFCQQLMKDKGLKNEDELQSYFIRRIGKFLHSKGRQMIGWDEILEGGLASNAIVESWRGTSGGIAAARLGHDVVMASQNYVYFDYPQGKGSDEPISNSGYGRYTPLDKVYSYDPTPSALSREQQKHILGIEACIWTEFMPTSAKVEYMILPRMLALSEIAWSPLSVKDYPDFTTIRLPKHLARLDAEGFLYRVPPAIGVQDTTLFGGRFTFALQPPVEGANIYYTIDGYTPDETTYRYHQPVTVIVPKGEKRILKTVVITPSGKRSSVTATVLDNASGVLKP